MIIWGLDLATHTGYCVLDTETKKFTSGFINNYINVLDKVETRPYQFWLRLHDLKEAYGTPKHIAYEKINFSSSTAATQSYGMLLGTLLVFCSIYNIAFIPISTSTVKKTGGSGRNSKTEQIASAKVFAQKFGFDPFIDVLPLQEKFVKKPGKTLLKNIEERKGDIADAIHCLRSGLITLGILEFV